MDIKTIQILALFAVEEPDAKANYRHICRWYSREFSTPLLTVEQDIPEIEVLRHYYEDHYTKMSEDKTKDGILRYLELKEDLLQNNKDMRTLEDNLKADEEWAAEMEAEMKAEEEAIVTQKATQTLKKIDPKLLEEINITKKGEK